MKQYTGTIVVNAKSVTRKEYYAFRRWELREGDNPEDVGYIVEYCDTEAQPELTGKANGYIAWAPKNVFEKSYKLTDNYMDRLQIELDELYTRMEKLGNFLSKPKPENLIEEEWRMLQEQLDTMDKYYNILTARITVAKTREQA